MRYILGICNTNKNTNSPQRMQSGDIIDYRPYSSDWKPSEKQLKDFRYVEIDIKERNNVEALCEAYFDTTIQTLNKPNDPFFTYKNIVAKRRFNVKSNKKVIKLTDIDDKVKKRKVSVDDGLTYIKLIPNLVGA